MTAPTTACALSDERLTRLTHTADAVVALGLTGRWRWAGDTKWSGPWLSTVGGGMRAVLGFRRKGMDSAQPTFPHLREGHSWPLMVKADEVPIFEVCPEATSKTDPRVYRQDIVGLRTPVAQYLAEVDAETVLALVAEVRALRAKTDGGATP